MAAEIVEVFAPVPHGVVVDATMGGAGHTVRLLTAYPWMRVLGIDVPRYKLAAFAMGTALAGLSRAFYTYHLGFIGAESFGFVESITVLSMVVFGGIASVPGVIIAAALLSVLPAWFQVIGDYKLLVYGGLLFVMMRFSPGGMAGLAARVFRTSSLPNGGKR